MLNEIEKYGYAVRLILQRKNMKAEELVFRVNQSQTIIISKSVLSRIMTGKRLITPTEAERIAEVLETPSLYEAYEYLNEYIEMNNGVSALKFHEVIDLLLNEGCIDDDNNELVIDYGVLQKMINRLYQYCLKVDVSDQIKEGFMTKVSQVRGLGEMIERLMLMYHCFTHGKNISIKDRAWIAAALLYFISPIDLIPDHLLPFGYIDDAIVVSFVFNKLNAIFKNYRVTKMGENIAGFYI